MKIFLHQFKALIILLFATALTASWHSASAQIVDIGTGTASNTNQGLPTPYQNYYWGSKQQFLILKSELTALGITSGRNLNSIGFNVTALNSTPPGGYLETYIRIKHVTYNAMPSVWETGLTQVFYAATYTPTLGWNIHNFSTPFTWDGASNIVVEVCNNAAAWTSTSNASVFFTTTSFASALLYNTDASGVCGSPATVTSTFDRTNMRLNFTLPGPGNNPSLYPPIANFAYDKGIDTVWINSPYAFVNTSTGDSANYWRVTPSTGATNCINDVPGYGCYNQVGNTRNFRYMFTDTGSYLVTLITRNRTGKDSLSKWVYVGYPTKKPRANFFMDKQVIGVSEQIPAYDLSENGPTNWQWTVSPYCRGCATDPNAYPNDFLSSPNVQLPLLRARDAGKFDVCLKVWNSVGADSICKKDYVEIIGGLSMCASAADTIGTKQDGYVYDNGGPNQPYFPNIMGNCYYTIDPCASSVTAYLERFKLRNQDTIIFRNGGPTGAILRKLGGGNIPENLKTITASSGRLYMQWQLGAPQNASVGDSGIVIRWTSTPATYGAPNAYFTSLDTAYSGQKITYFNASIGQGNLSYNWDVNGDGIYNDFNSPNGASFTFTTVAPLLKDVCVRVSNCKGTSVYCKRIIVLPVQTRPIADFMSPRPAGFTTDTFRLIDISKNGPNRWTWTITPKNVVYVNGTDSSSQRPIFMLTVPGKYAVKLKAQNGLGVDSIEKFFFIDVLAYNSPNTDLPIASASDVGITRVVFDNVDTTTALKTPTYTALYNLKRAVLYRGVQYKLEVMRPTAITPMERKAWIDLNFDADFIDAGETILSESNGLNPKTEAFFKLPDNIAPGRVTRLRVGVSDGGTSLTPDMARSGCFEDYGVEVGLDDVVPTIALKGEAVHRVQRNTIYFDPGVTAMDNREGDISARYEWSNNIDMTQVGVYKARYWVKDLYGNVSDTIERTIQVELNQVGPKVTLVGADTIRLEAKRDSYVELGATAVDNVNNDITSRIRKIGYVDTAYIGTYYVNYSVSDEFGFTGEKTRVVIVQKTSKPRLTLQNQNLTYVKHQIYTPYTLGAGLKKDDDYFGPDQLTLTATGAVDVSTPGSYFVQYTICDPIGNCSNPFLVQVEVQDTVAPVVNLLGANPLLVDVYNSNFADPGVNSSDNYYSSNSLIRITQKNVNVNKLGNYNITYIVRDGSGNETRIVRDVQVVDRVAPSIEILGGNPFDQTRFKDYEEPGIRINDNYDSEDALKAKLIVTSNLATRPDGVTLWADLDGWRYVRYQVSDNSGNVSAVAERVVRVVTVTGVDEVLSNGNLVVYPNPSNGKFTIGLNETMQGKTAVVIYNVLGAKVYADEFTQTTNAYDINAQDLKAGIYLIQVTNNGNQYTQRITIK